MCLHLSGPHPSVNQVKRIKQEMEKHYNERPIPCQHWRCKLFHLSWIELLVIPCSTQPAMLHTVFHIHSYGVIVNTADLTWNWTRESIVKLSKCLSKYPLSIWWWLGLGTHLQHQLWSLAVTSTNFWVFVFFTLICTMETRNQHIIIRVNELRYKKEAFIKVYIPGI